MLNNFDFNRKNNYDKRVYIAHLKLLNVVYKDLATILV